MRHRKLLNLLARNARKGEFRAESGEAGNVIYVYDVIVASEADAEWFGGVAADTFARTLAGMSGDVALRINSPGGDVFGAKAMAQALREYDGKIIAHVDGYAASAATYLTSVADETVMAPGSMMMIHKAWTIELGNAEDFRATAALLDKIDGTIVETYAAAADRRGKDAADFAALMSAETWLTAAEAIELGLADEQSADKPANKVKWDLSAYEHPPTAAPDDEEEVPEDPDEIEPAADADVNDEIEEPARPNVAADLLLRPAA